MVEVIFGIWFLSSIIVAMYLTWDDSPNDMVFPAVILGLLTGPLFLFVLLWQGLVIIFDFIADKDVRKD